MNPEGVTRQAGLLAKGILSLLVPPLCVACERKLETDRRWLCLRCRMALAAEVRRMDAVIGLGGNVPLEVRYCFRYTPRVSRIITEMKYGDKPGLASVLVSYMAFVLGGFAAPGTAAIPVPIHASKRRERGYNQSRLLAEGLARSMGIDFGDMLVKTRITVSQTTLERHRRLSNVTGSIGWKAGGPPPFEKALLVDDVVTTGSTLRECALVLRSAGMKEISACAVAASL
jgi:ComF family protein